MKNEIFLVLTTEESKLLAQSLIDFLLSRKVIACASINKLESSFWWNNHIQKTIEFQILMKTSNEKIDQVLALIKEKHSYTTPEIIFWPVSSSYSYFNWVTQITS